MLLLSRRLRLRLLLLSRRLIVLMLSRRLIVLMLSRRLIVLMLCRRPVVATSLQLRLLLPPFVRRITHQRHRRRKQLPPRESRRERRGGSRRARRLHVGCIDVSQLRKVGRRERADHERERLPKRQEHAARPERIAACLARSSA